MVQKENQNLKTYALVIAIGWRDHDEADQSAVKRNT